jgi:hypothetical protein
VAWLALLASLKFDPLKQESFSHPLAQIYSPDDKVPPEDGSGQHG